MLLSASLSGKYVLHVRQIGLGHVQEELTNDTNLFFKSLPHG
jgi:hypothetical protein